MSAAAKLPQVPDTETIRRVTRQVVEQPEFDPPWPWLERVVSILQTIKEWLDGLEAWALANPQFARVLTVLAVIVLVGLLIHLLYLALGDLIPWRRVDKATPASSFRWQILEGTARNWREGAELALRHLEQGELRRAVWIAHRVLLGLLDERGALKFAGGKTNSQYLSECPAGHPWYATLAELTQVYEQAIYAQRSAAAAAIAPLITRVNSMTTEQ
jgi:hypothetical protein